MQLNIGPTQQSIEANTVYQRAALEKVENNRSSSDDESVISALISVFLLFMALMSVGMPLKEHIDFDVTWQAWSFWTVELVVALITGALMRYLLIGAYIGIAISISYFLIDKFVL